MSGAHHKGREPGARKRERERLRAERHEAKRAKRRGAAAGPELAHK
jgi:hypothetical protein